MIGYTSAIFVIQINNLWYIMNTYKTIRTPIAAGQFYPQNAIELNSLVDVYLDNNCTSLVNKKPLAMIVPHASYYYSAAIAASAYKQLLAHQQNISKVVLLGPSHHIPLIGAATSSVSLFQTPLGNIPLDQRLIEKLNQLSFVEPHDEAHLQEHSLEVQLPFLQKVLPQFSLIPLVVGKINAQQISQIIDNLWQEKEILFLISSDLSHHLDYQRARQCDQLICQQIETLNSEYIQREHACCHTAIAGLLLNAQARQLHVKTLDLRNSGDTTGDKKRVTGYGAWAFYS